MRKSALMAAVALTATLALSACNKQEDAQQPVQQQAQQLTKPTDPTNVKAWNDYLGQLVQNNLQGMKASQPYAYLIDGGSTDDAEAANNRQLANVKDVVSRGVLPGNLLAFAGANSAKTADLLISGFSEAKPGAFKDVIVVFIGDKADEQRVEDALKPTAASVHFVAM